MNSELMATRRDYSFHLWEKKINDSLHEGRKVSGLHSLMEPIALPKSARSEVCVCCRLPFVRLLEGRDWGVIAGEGGLFCRVCLVEGPF